jgi:hypothetical protein
MSRTELGRLIVGTGAVLVLVGVLVWSGALAWFGRLPGDIRVERETVRIYIPLASMLVLSIALSLLLGLVRRFF